jgi:DNA polymerase sigma
MQKPRERISSWADASESAIAEVTDKGGKGKNVQVATKGNGRSRTESLPEPAPEPDLEPERTEANPSQKLQHVKPKLEVQDITKDQFRKLILEKLRTKEDDKLVQECLTKLEAVVRKGLEEGDGETWRVSAFGSVVTKMGTRGCDLDVTVYEQRELKEEEDNSQNKGETTDSRTIIGKLGYLLEGSDFVVKGTILHARVPILKLQYKGQDVDLSVNNIRPLKNSRLLRAYASLDDEVAVLIVAVKHWAKERNLCGAANGHLSSYAFALMVIYFLQVTDMGQMPCLQARGEEDEAFEDDVSAEKLTRAAKANWNLRKSMSFEMWLSGFFAFYAGTQGPYLGEHQPPFNWGDEVVSIRLGKRLSKSSSEFRELKGRQEVKLHIEDPFERSRNLRDVMWTHPKDHETSLFDQVFYTDQAYKLHAIAQLPQMLASASAAGAVPGFPPMFPPVMPPLGKDHQADLAAGMPPWSPWLLPTVETLEQSHHRKGGGRGRGLPMNSYTAQSWATAKAAFSSHRTWQQQPQKGKERRYD